jgi:hypothetical protein
MVERDIEASGGGDVVLSARLGGGPRSLRGLLLIAAVYLMVTKRGL